MIKKINYTGRKKISQDKIDIKLYNVGGLRTFEANVNLEGLKIPGAAKIYVEPYFKTSFMRFEFGTVEHQTQPLNRELQALPDSGIVFFRIKIVDESVENGKLLGYADEITPSNQQDVPANKTGILTVNFEADDLDQEIWRLNMNEGIPILDINKKIDDRRELVKTEVFISLVYPAIVRQLAMEIGRQYEEFEDGSSDWQSIWIKFIKDVLGISYGPEKEAGSDDSNEENLQIWANIVAESFCRKLNTLNKINNNIQKLLA